MQYVRSVLYSAGFGGLGFRCQSLSWQDTVKRIIRDQVTTLWLSQMTNSDTAEYCTISINSAGPVMRDGPAEFLVSAGWQSSPDNFFFPAVTVAYTLTALLIFYYHNHATTILWIKKIMAWRISISAKILDVFCTCKMFSAPVQNQRDDRAFSALWKGTVMRDCRIDRNGTELSRLIPALLKAMQNAFCCHFCYFWVLGCSCNPFPYHFLLHFLLHFLFTAKMIENGLKMGSKMSWKWPKNGFHEQP